MAMYWPDLLSILYAKARINPDQLDLEV